MPVWLLGLGARLKLVPVGVWLALAGALAAAGMLVVHDHRVAADAKAKQYTADKKALDRTRANYEAAAAKAAQDDAANKARVEAEQAAINERTDHDYQTRVAAARAEFERLRAQSEARAHPGSGAGAGVPGLPSTASVVDEAAREDRFPVADQLTATEQAIQLDELISWVKEQHAVDVNGAQPSEQKPVPPLPKHRSFFQRLWPF